jgi:molybdopterin/thiamine biosynthesis adenylyltransferase
MFRRKSKQAGSSTTASPSGASVDDAALYSRNWLFISAEVQAKLRRAVIFAVGVGLASNIMTLACRTGFTRFIVADGDTVDLSNLNRQAFSREQIGTNKAEATAALLRGIRPDVEVEVLPRIVDERYYVGPLARADLVVNSIDFDQPMAFTLNRAAQEAKKPVLLPMNLGWGGALLTFTHESPSLEAFLGYQPGKDAPAEVVKRLVTRVFEHAPQGLPPYLGSAFSEFMAPQTAWSYDPQLGVAAYLTTAMTVRAAVALVAGESVRTVPDVAHCDVRTLLEPQVLSPASATTAAAPAPASAAPTSPATPAPDPPPAAVPEKRVLIMPGGPERRERSEL